MYVSKDMSIYGYFSNPIGVREQKSLGNTDLGVLRRTNLDPFIVIFSDTAK
jgi:hypothetical protein